MAEIPSFDIVIIGCGIAGAGLAAMIGEKKKVLILEREAQPGYHSTGRSAAIFIQNYGSPEIRDLNKASYDFLAMPPKDFSEKGFLSPRGMMLVADKDGAGKMDAELQSGDGLVAMTVSDAKTMVPILDADVIEHAAFEKNAQDIDVAALHQSYIRRAKQSGATLICNCEIDAAEQTEAGWQVQTNNGVYHAEIIVNAAGAWADPVAEICGVKPLGITPMRRTIAVLPTADNMDCSAWPLVVDAQEKWYMKPEGKNLLVSPSDEVPVEPHDAYVDDMVLAEGLHEFECATTFEVHRVENQWAGLRSFAPDRNPVVGFDEGNNRFFWLAGQGGYGIQTSPALSNLAATLLLGNEKSSNFSTELVSGLWPGRFTDK
ncbi:MAG: FAD-binding oxidoreductase [Sneathiella sp.]